MQSAELLATVERLSDIDVDTLDRDELADVVSHATRVRGWLDALELRCARHGRTLAVAGRAESAANLLAASSNRSSREAEQITRRGAVADAMPVFEDGLDAGTVSAGHLDAIANATRSAAPEVRAAFAVHEHELVAHAAADDIDTFTRRCRSLVAQLTSELTDNDASELDRQRAASRIRRWVTATDGMHHTELALDPLRDEIVWNAVNRSLRSMQQRNGNARTPWNELQVDAFVGTVLGGPGAPASRPTVAATATPAASSPAAPPPSQVSKPTAGPSPVAASPSCAPNPSTSPSPAGGPAHCVPSQGAASRPGRSSSRAPSPAGAIAGDLIAALEASMAPGTGTAGDAGPPGARQPAPTTATRTDTTSDTGADTGPPGARQPAPTVDTTSDTGADTAADIAIADTDTDTDAQDSGTSCTNPAHCDHSAPPAVGHGVAEISVLVDLSTLVDGLHTNSICETEDGTPLPVSTVRRLCCDAEVLPIVLGTQGETLDVGRTRRTVTRAQRRALRAMHHTCAHPQCTVTFSQCKIHHVRWWWRDRGPTDIDNLLPLCEQHHHLVHEGGWTLTMTCDRVATWTRPDGSVHHHGTTIDRQPTSRHPPPAANPRPPANRAPAHLDLELRSRPLGAPVRSTDVDVTAV